MVALSSRDEIVPSAAVAAAVARHAATAAAGGGRAAVEAWMMEGAEHGAILFEEERHRALADRFGDFYLQVGPGGARPGRGRGRPLLPCGGRGGVVWGDEGRATGVGGWVWRPGRGRGGGSGAGGEGKGWRRHTEVVPRSQANPMASPATDRPWPIPHFPPPFRPLPPVGFAAAAMGTHAPR